jgi:hypothetical protein
LILLIDQYVDSYIAAFSPANGETLWKTSRSETSSWATPIIYRPRGDGSAHILTVGDHLFGVHQLQTGKRTYTSATVAGAMVASPVVVGDRFFTFGYNMEGSHPFAEQLAKFDKDGDGKISALESSDDPWVNGLARFLGDKDGLLTRDEWDAMVKDARALRAWWRCVWRADATGRLSIPRTMEDEKNFVESPRRWSMTVSSIT